MGIIIQATNPDMSLSRNLQKMNFDLTRSNLFATTFYSIVLLIVFWGSGSSLTLHVAIAENPDQTIITIWLEQFIENNPFFTRTLSAFLVFGCSIMVAQLAIRNVIFLERTYMPSMLFVIIASAFYNSGQSLLPLMVAALMVKAISMIFKSYVIKRVASGAYLVIGFYFGLAALIYPPAIYMLLIMYLGLAIFRIGSFKEWIAATVGALLPLGLFFYILWITSWNVQYEITAYIGQLEWHSDIGRIYRQFNLVHYTFIGTILVLTLLSIITFVRSKKSYKLRSRLAYIFLLIAMLWSMIVMLVSPVRSFYMLPIVAIGGSALIPAYFASRKPNFLSIFLYALLILSSIAIHVIHF